ncbi:MAG: aminoglycoside phosphotransferase [Microbacterium sp.]|nr:aminoglycoside phosphotransferase [Microbacterium sp.]
MATASSLPPGIVERIVDALGVVTRPAETLITPMEAGSSGDRVWHVHTRDGIPDAVARWAPSAPGGSDDERSVGTTALRLASEGGLTVPAVLHDERQRDGRLTIVAFCDGETLAGRLARAPDEAEHWGAACGDVLARLHAAHLDVSALPSWSAAWAMPPTAAARASVHATFEGTRQSMLHLDLHPFNVIVRDSEVSGVIDWANARRGPALLDLARTHSLVEFIGRLTSTPASPGSALAPDLLPRFGRALHDAYVARSAPIDDARWAVARAWAFAVLEADIRPKAGHVDYVTPDVLAWISRRREEAQAAAR